MIKQQDKKLNNGSLSESKLSDKKLTTLIYFVIGVVGVAIASLFVAEAQQNKQLLSDNYQLLSNTIQKTLISQLQEKSNKYPKTSEQIEDQWLTLAKDFYLFDQRQRYPYQFSGSPSLTLSDKWQQLTPQGEISTSTGLSDAELLRFNALNSLSIAIKSQNNQAITEQTKTYFDLVANYKVSALSEVIFALKFLTIDDKNQWNDSLVRQILLSGNSLFKPVAYYLYQENNHFTQADVDKVQQTMLQLLEQANLSTTWLVNNTQLMLNTKPLELESLKSESFKSAQPKPAKKIGHYLLFNDGYIHLELDNNYRLLIPYNLAKALPNAITELKQQGVLTVEDTVTINPVLLASSNKPIALTDISFSITKPAWQQLAQQQQWFFITKSVLLVVFIVSLIIVSRSLINQQKKKQSYIAMREQFINLVSHELKTPLAAIRVMAETVEKRSNKSLSLKDYPTRMINEVDRLWLMVDNLLSMNRLKSNEVALTLQSVNLHNIVKYSFEKHHEHSNKPATLNNTISGGVMIEVDELLFELVISNIISNAIKYNDKSNIQLKFSFDEAQQVLTVIDNSCGIEPQQWQQVFDEFQRIPQQKAISGNGIGLALCKLILKQHNADISIQKSNEAGTTWLIAF